MAAASYFSGGRLQDEDYLESQAREVESGIVKLQSRIRGFLVRFHRDFAVNVSRDSLSDRREVTRTLHLGRRKAEVVGTSHEHSTENIGDPVEDVDDNLKSAKPPLRNPGFAEKKVSDVPDGWLVARTSNGDPFFFQTETSYSTWMHPHQHDANYLFGADFDICWAWKKWLAHRTAGVSHSDTMTPTIGELAVHFRATEGCDEPFTRSLWWRESGPSSLNGSLCEVCRHIDFDALLHTVNAWGQTSAIPLGSLRSIANKLHCAFCRLVSRTAFPVINGVLMNLDELGGRCNLIQNQEWESFSTRIRTVYLNLEIPARQDPWKRAPLSIPFGRIHQILRNEETRPPEQKYNDSRLVKDQIDVELVKAWLNTCEQRHQSILCESSLPYPSFVPPEATDVYSKWTRIKQPCQPLPLSDDPLALTLIDVQLSCLVNTKPGVRYIALSYVWGGPQPFQNTKSRNQMLHTPGTVSAEDAAIPQTIRDAMKIVGMLGERYLWVDSLCIVQDSTRGKMEQISNMGNIYSCAILTVVAAHGSSCHAGLPGVQPGSRNSTQHTEEIQGMLLSNELNYLHEIMSESVWNTRAWTYQERELSKRCLFFTKNCVYFSCNQMVCKEDSGLRNVGLWSEKHKRVRAERHPIWNNYRRAVKKFTQRTFTFDEDVINAFEGIVSLLQPAFKSDFLYGLPETELDVALLWQPASGIRRRIDKSTGEPLFPSWSWAGWVGEIDYVWTDHLLDDLSRVQWQVHSADEQGYVTSDQLRAPNCGKHGTWGRVEAPGSNRQVTGTPAYYQPEYPDVWCLHPTAPKEARLAHPLLLPGAHELRFKAQTAMLEIVAKTHTTHPFGNDALSCCNYSQHIRCPVKIISTDGFVAGTVYVPAHIMGTLTNKPYEFVCLSRRRGWYGDTIGHDLYAKYEGEDTYPQPRDDFEGVPQHPTLYPGQYQITKTQDKYDHTRFNKNKPWPLYNVMLIERKGDLAFRVAIGIVHVTAFLQAKPVERLIILA